MADDDVARDLSQSVGRRVRSGAQTEKLRPPSTPPRISRMRLPRSGATTSGYAPFAWCAKADPLPMAWPFGPDRLGPDRPAQGAGAGSFGRSIIWCSWLLGAAVLDGGTRRWLLSQAASPAASRQQVLVMSGPAPRGSWP